MPPRAPTSCSRAGDGSLEALNGGYHAAFLVGAIFAFAAAAIGAIFLRAGRAESVAVHEAPEPHGVPAAACAD